MADESKPKETPIWERYKHIIQIAGYVLTFLGGIGALLVKQQFDQKDKPDFVVKAEYGPFHLPPNINFDIIEQSENGNVLEQSKKESPFQGFLKLAITNTGSAQAPDVRVQTGYVGFARVEFDDGKSKQFPFTSDIKIGEIATRKQVTVSIWTTETILPRSAKIAVIPQVVQPIEVELPVMTLIEPIFWQSVMLGLTCVFVLVTAYGCAKR